MAEDDNINAPVGAAAGCVRVGYDRVVFGISGGTEASGIEAVPHNEKPHDLGRTRRGELPI